MGRERAPAGAAGTGGRGRSLRGHVAKALWAAATAAYGGGIMRKFSTIAALVSATFLLVACNGEDEMAAPEPQEMAGEQTATESSAPETTSEEAPAEQSGPGITTVDDTQYMPEPSATNTRVFQLADGATECFINDLAGDGYLTCRTNFVEPPLVPAHGGQEVPANAVTWAPYGVTYAVMDFPQVPQTAVLHPRERIEFAGFTCTSYGPATVECVGPSGAATLDAGRATGVGMPPEEAPAPAPEEEPAPAGPQLPGAEELLPPLPGQ